MSFFSDKDDGVCSNSITIGEVDRSSTVYTVVSGEVLPAQSVSGSVSGASVHAATMTKNAEEYDDEAERLYREYVAGLHNDEHKAFLAPTYTGSTEDVKLLIYSQQPEQATVTVYSAVGQLITTKQVYLGSGVTEHRLSAQEKPHIIGMYYVEIHYANGTRETLKGVVK
jgi:hypothetical protein